MITGFIRPEQGKVMLDEQDITFMPVYKRARLGLGYLSQEPSIFRKLSVEENIVAVLELLGRNPSERRQMFESLMAKLNIGRLAKQKAGHSRAASGDVWNSARALAPQPDFLLLDEPFTGIDPIVRAEIQDIIRALKRDGLGVLITDHNVRRPWKSRTGPTS